MLTDQDKAWLTSEFGRRFDKIESRLDRIEQRLDRIEHNVNLLVRAHPQLSSMVASAGEPRKAP